jgi:hypothetical protein
MPARKNNFAVFASILIIIIACSDDEFPQSPYPTVKTIEVNEIMNSGANFLGEISDLGELPILNHGFVWGTNHKLHYLINQNIQLGPLSKTKSFSTQASLQEKTTYFMAAFVTTENYVMYGEVISFKTP